MSHRRWDPKTSAVVVVDVQNDFCDPAGFMAQSGFNMMMVEPMVSRLSGFLTTARAAGVLVVFVRTEHDESLDSAVWHERLEWSESASQPRPVVCRSGTWGTDFYRVAPQPRDLVVTKTRYSGFVGTNLDLVLRAEEVRSLLFTGIATEGCVESSLRDGLSHDYHVGMVEDCVASYDDESHRATIKTVSRVFGQVATSDQVRAHWKSACV